MKENNTPNTLINPSNFKDLSISNEDFELICDNLDLILDDSENILEKIQDEENGENEFIELLFYYPNIKEVILQIKKCNSRIKTRFKLFNELVEKEKIKIHKNGLDDVEETINNLHSILSGIELEIRKKLNIREKYLNEKN